MEETKKSYLKYVVPVSIIAVVVVAAVVVYTTQMAGDKAAMKQTAPVEVVEVAPNDAMMQQENASGYKDGTYTVTGKYVSPGGPREVGVTVTLKDGIVTDSTFEGRATDPASMRFQKEFAEGYKAMVVGKPIEDLALTKVSGSSLTPKGFNDALEQIRAKAQS